MWTTLIDEWSSWMTAADLSPQTVRLRRCQIRRVSERFPDPLAVTLPQLTSVMATPSWSPDYRRSMRAALRSFFGFCVEFGYLEASPADRLPRVRTPRGAPKPCPTYVYEAALDCASHRERLMILLAAQAGLRRIEIARVSWLDLTDEGLRVRGKGDHVRVIPIAGSQLAVELEAERGRRAVGRFGSGWRYRMDPRSSFVFPGSDGGHISPDRVGHLLAAALGDHWTGHKLRHRFATRGFQGTHDLRAVQEALGHSSPASTARYTLVSSESIRRVVEAAA